RRIALKKRKSMMMLLNMLWKSLIMNLLETVIHQKKVVRSGVPMKKKSPTSKSHVESAKSKRASGSIYMATEQVYHITLKSIISSIVPHCPKEILVEILKFINMIYPKIKDHCLNTVMPNDTVKRRELAWEDVKSY